MRSLSVDGKCPPWVLVSAGFHEQGGQSRANAALADFLLARGTPVRLVGHDFDERFRAQPLCSVHPVSRPRGSDFLGVLKLRREGRAVASEATAGNSKARVVVNGGCCQWGDVNWVHYVHHGWREPLRTAPLGRRLKEAITGGFFRRHEHRALSAARMVLANSEQTRRLLMDRLKLAPNRVRTVYLGSDPRWTAASETERAAARHWLNVADAKPLVLFVGGLGYDERKGFDTLWAAWRERCADPAWDADLLVVGGGARAGEWEKRVVAGGLTKRVRFLGVTDRVFEVLAAADLLVSPVRYEPYGLNVQEAICRGVPALVSACAGVVEQYRPELACLVLLNPDDPRELAARLRNWRADMDGWRQRFRGLGDEFRRYAWADMAARIVDLVEDGTRAREGLLCV